METEAIWAPSIIQAESLRNSFRRFVREGWKHVDPAPLVWGWHLDATCDHFSYMTLGDIRFLLINEPPRTSKSLVASVFWPAWHWLHYPSEQFLTASYTLQLSIRDCLRTRRLFDSPWFQERWGHEWSFAYDERLKRQFSNDKGGRRIAIAVESATTGEGGDKLVCDDPHNATEVESDAIRLGTHDWWDHAMSSRLNNPDKSGWVVVGQRTGEDDLFGHILKTHDMSEIVHLVLPNEYDTKRRCITRLPKTGKVIFRDPRTEPGQLLCPARISEKATKRLKRVMKDKYHLQYQQDPEAGGGAILRRDQWRLWEQQEPPEIELLLSVYDTAFEEGQENDYSARTDWGVFPHRAVTIDPKTKVSVPGKERRHIILLGAWRDRVAYHDLKRTAREHFRKVRSDYTLVEYKGSGIILAKDLIRGGIRGVRKVRLDHGGRVKLDKVERANIASTVLDDGLVYYMPRKWATAVIDECANFPKGAHDDWVDTCLMAWQFVRRMNEVGLWEEQDDDSGIRLFKRSEPGRKAMYG